MGRGERSIESRIRSWELRFYSSLDLLLRTLLSTELPPWRRAHPLRLLALPREIVLRHLWALSLERPDPPFTEIEEITDDEDDE